MDTDTRFVLSKSTMSKSKVLKEIVLAEKITCCLNKALVFGGFLGGVIKISAQQYPVVITQVEDPVSALAIKGNNVDSNELGLMGSISMSGGISNDRVGSSGSGMSSSISNDRVVSSDRVGMSMSISSGSGMSMSMSMSGSSSGSVMNDEVDSKLAIGTWKGEVKLGGGGGISIGRLPCKYLQSMGGIRGSGGEVEEYWVASDANGLVVLVEEKLVSGGRQLQEAFRWRLGTYLLKWIVNGDGWVGLTGFSVVWVERGEKGEFVVSNQIAHIHADREETETLVCLVESQGRLFAGTIGGWLVELLDWSDATTFQIKHLKQVSTEKITDLITYTVNDKSYFICTTPNHLHIIDQTKLSHLDQFELSKTNSLGWVRVCPDQLGLLAVLDICHRIYFVDITAVTGQNQPGPALPSTASVDDIYQDLLAQVNSGQL
ncbi:hypothetical protein NEHOM01_1498 [Nematocida homosporus]|uniref:uncharacterized protein n=1 Tax=Nematocida homosporus TaxID=1912981 RepID=UPI00221F13C9|nr:uncharacterized protein NEHOM01_1498 [Nematocida homosporus]KAI5186486.1 hypothetical protein NEHOM01_1498 [Nematocida homosporus]